MQSIQGYLEKLGSNFLVAALIPSLAFITISILAFGPILPDAVISRLGGKGNPINSYWPVLLLFTTIVGFTLSSLNTFVYKIFEGYVFFRHFSILKRKQIKRAQKIQLDLKRIDKARQRWNRRFEGKNKNSKRYKNKLKAIERLKSSLELEFDISFPPSEEDILPTRFGNVLRAAESYSVIRYGIQSIPVWPRLIYVIPDSYLAKIDQSNNELSFLLNCSLLSALFAFLCFLASLYQLFLSFLSKSGEVYLLYFIPISLPEWIYQQRSGLYFGIGLLTLGIAWIFNKASHFVVSDYGNMIRSAFDLFRSQLLIELNLELPKDSEDEIKLWEELSQFMLVGDLKGELPLVEYHYRDKAEKMG